MSVEDINRLPHLAPVRFVTEVLLAGELNSACIVSFEEEPTLAAIVEAAAQNVIFIASLYRDFDGGVLTAMKKVKLLKPLAKGSYKVESVISARLDNFSMFKFTLSQDNRVLEKLGSGEFTPTIGSGEFTPTIGEAKAITSDEFYKKSNEIFVEGEMSIVMKHRENNIKMEKLK